MMAQNIHLMSKWFSSKLVAIIEIWNQETSWKNNILQRYYFTEYDVITLQFYALLDLDDQCLQMNIPLILVLLIHQHFWLGTGQMKMKLRHGMRRHQKYVSLDLDTRRFSI